MSEISKSRKTTGFGLGLTFVHKVVCAYGGKIHIESEIGNGSKFLIILPQVSWKKLKVLYAEDDPLTVMEVAEQLEERDLK